MVTMTEQIKGNWHTVSRSARSGEYRIVVKRDSTSAPLSSKAKAEKVGRALSLASKSTGTFEPKNASD